MENKKVVIITGASKGIGRAAAMKFATNGFALTLVDIAADELSITASLAQKKYEANCLLCSGDISDTDFQKQIITQTVEKFGRIDVLVNNAAWRTIESMRSIEMDIWEQTIKVCLTAPAFLAKLSAAVMEASKISGVIINVSSMMSERAAGYSPAYIAAKGGLDSLTKELSITYGRSGIRVLGVNPGFIETDMSHDYKSEEGNDLNEPIGKYLLDATPLGRSGKPEEVAEAIFWLSSEAASFITGTSLLIDGGFKHNMNSYELKKMQLPKDF